MEKGTFECKPCNIKLENVRLPVYHDCPFEKKQKEPVKKQPWKETDCIHIGEVIGEIPCSCPSAGKEDVYQCSLHQVPCSRTGSRLSHRQEQGLENLRSCLKCWGMEEGYKEKEPTDEPQAP